MRRQVAAQRLVVEIRVQVRQDRPPGADPLDQGQSLIHEKCAGCGA